MRKAEWLLCVAVILMFSSCSQQSVTAETTFQPPIDGVEWGMMPEEVAEILSLPEECTLNSEKIATIQCEDMDVFGQKADVEMTFDMQSQIGLLNVRVYFEDYPEESFLDTLNNIYGEYSAIDREGVRGLWENEKIEELPERIQERFQYMWVEFPPRDEEQEIFSKETIWNAYKVQPLVTVNLNGEFLNYYGGNMAAYLIYDDDAAYEEWQSYLKSIWSRSGQ